MAKPLMYYFGCWSKPGHIMVGEGGFPVLTHERRFVPWNGMIDGILQPGCFFEYGAWRSTGTQPEGEALLHQKEGWTAISFWDRTIDIRFGSNSTYLAEGTFTFDEMVQMAKARFTERWNRMAFPVRLATPI